MIPDTCRWFLYPLPPHEATLLPSGPVAPTSWRITQLILPLTCDLVRDPLSNSASSHSLLGNPIPIYRLTCSIMRYVLPLVALGVSASATHVSNQNSQCTFPMTAVSNPGGPIVREAIGNNRIGGASSLQDVYSIGQRSMSDSHGYDCMIDPSSSRFYCSQDAHANANFSVANDGRLLHNGSAKWLACEATGPDASGSYHIYTDQKHDTTGCKDITINTYVHSCHLCRYCF